MDVVETTMDNIDDLTMLFRHEVRETSSVKTQEKITLLKTALNFVVNGVKISAISTACF